MQGPAPERIMRLAGTLVASLYFLHYMATSSEWHFIDNADLIFHEAGHAIFSFFGEFIHILMGSGFQILLPLSIAIYFFYHKQRISGAITLMWAGANLINVSIYAGDAIAMQLPLLGGDSVIHDWNYILTQMGILRWTPQVASALYGLGATAIIIGAILSLWFAFQTPEESPPRRDYF